LPWRLPNDRALITFERNKMMALADFIWLCCTSKGVADFEVIDHVVTQMTYEAGLTQQFFS